MDPDDVREEWRQRTGEYSPEYYAYRGADETSETLRELLAHYVGTDARVLEVGSGSGRHLEALRRAGFRDLHGIEINPDAVAVLREEYPQLADVGTFHVGDAGELLPSFDADAFDAVYSVETLQHIHPDEAEAVFDAVARVAGELLVTVENESAMSAGVDDDPDVSYVRDEFPLYHRDWKSIFESRGFVQLLSEPGERDTLRAFRHP